jgi:predicted nucleotide-binding protein
MYSLLVSQAASELNGGSIVVDRRRFLEYTEDSIALQLRGLSVEASDCLRSWPCIVMQEGRGVEAAFLVQFEFLKARSTEIALTVRPSRDRITISNETLWKYRVDFDIGDFEFSRNHWAVKDRDLWIVMEVAGYQVPNATKAIYAQLPLPIPSRAELLRARDVISEWGHTKIDDLLIESGVDIPSAGRVGSRRDRANAIVRFALENPIATTAENSLLGPFLIKSTIDTTSGLAPIGSNSVTAVPEPAMLEESRTPTQPAKSRIPNRVFIVHGRNEAPRNAVVEFLQTIGLEGIVLHEQPSMGRHLLTKFVEEADLVTFAIVLMTDDDVGGQTEMSLSPRTRQNVILELGYFLSHLGQHGVCALVTPGLETPSDFDGIVYIKMTQDERWKIELLRELKAAGLPLRMDN